MMAQSRVSSGQRCYTSPLTWHSLIPQQTVLCLRRHGLEEERVLPAHTLGVPAARHSWRYAHESGSPEELMRHLGIFEKSINGINLVLTDADMLHGDSTHGLCPANRKVCKERSVDTVLKLVSNECFLRKNGFRVPVIELCISKKHPCFIFPFFY